MKKIAVLLLVLVVSPVFGQADGDQGLDESVFPQGAPINEAQLVGLERTYTARQVYDIIGLPSCATDPPTFSCTTVDACVDDTNDALYVCIATVWTSVVGGGGPADAIETCSVTPPTGGCTDYDVCLGTDAVLYMCLGAWAPVQPIDASFNAELLRVWWIVAAMLVLLMQLGFICLEMGCIRPKSRPGIAVKNFVMLIVSTMTFTLIGAYLMYGPTFKGLIGLGPLQLWLDGSALGRGPAGSYGWLFFQAGFAAVAATIISGALAGRTTLFSNGFLAFVMTLLIYPIFGHWIWNDGGWLLHLGAKDFAGSGAVHFIGGVTALLAAKIAGPREGFIKDGKVQDLGSPNLPFATCGVILLWVGWIGFNGGSVLPDPHFLYGSDGFALVGQAVLATSIAASGGGLIVLLVAAFLHWKFGRGQSLSLKEALHQKILVDPWSILGGTMGGMVAITANCDWVSAESGGYFLWVAAGIGAAGGLAAFAVAYVVKQVLKVDDPVEAIGVHAGGGAAGILLASFASEGHLRVQLLVLAAGVACVLVIAYPCLYALRKLGLLRVSPTEEKLGLTFEPFESSVYTADMIRARRRADHR